MECPNCAAENLEGSSKCWECGQVLVEKAAVRPAGWVPWLVMAVAAVAVIGLVIAGGAGVSGGSSGLGAQTPTGTAEPTAAVEATVTSPGE